MALRVHLPTRFDVPDDWSRANRDQLAATVVRAIERATAETRREGTALEIVVPEPPRPAPHDAGERWYQVPSFGDGGRPTPVADITFEPEQVTVARPDPDVVVTSSGDRVMRRPFPTVTVIGGGGEDVAAGGAPYIIAGNLARAWNWGRSLFGGHGFAILQERKGGPHAPFIVVPLVDVLSVEDLGGLGQRQTLEGIDVAPIRTSGHLWPLADYLPVTVVTREGIRLANTNPQDLWSSVAVERAMAQIPAEQRLIDRAELLQITNTLLQAQRAARGAQGAVDLIVQMDRTIFAAMPWEQRVECLELLIDAWTGEREEIAILELMHGTRTISELEAIAAELRARGRYAQLFDDLDGRVFSLLQAFGEFRPAATLDWRYVLALIEELGFLPPGGGGGQGLSLDELARLAGGLSDWLTGTFEGIKTLFVHPRQVLEGLAHLAELLWTLERARSGDLEAQAFVSRMAREGAASAAKALRGLAYADELGLASGKRGGSARISGDITGRLKYVVLFEILSWFIGIGEIKAAIRATGLSERVAAIARALRALRFAGRAGAAAADTARLERVLVAIAEAARITDRARALRLAELLPEELLVALGRMAETVDLPDGATLNHLRQALAADTVLAGRLEEVADVLAVIERLEAKAGVGGVTADMTNGLHRLLRHAPWARQGGARLIDKISAAHLDEFMRTLEFVHPDHFVRWTADQFAQLAERPRWLAFIREAGSPLLESAFVGAGRDAGRFERLLDGLAIKRETLGDPAAYRRLLDRLQRGEEAVYVELLAESGVSRLRAGARQHLLADLDNIEKAAARDRYAAQLGELTDRELDGLEHIVRENRLGAATQHWASDVLELPAPARRYLLDLMNDVAPHTAEGLDLALRRLFEGGATDIQGGLGQFAAARTVLRRGLGNRLSFEVSQVSREIDIVVEGGGRRIHVEVKTNLRKSAGPGSARPSFDRNEILTDLVTHAESGYNDLLYLYHPDAAGRLPQHGRRMLRLFGDAAPVPGRRFRPPDAELARRFQAWGLDIDKARADFARWVHPANGRLTTYDR
jgi:hypothetical protein